MRGKRAPRRKTGRIVALWTAGLVSTGIMGATLATATATPPAPMATAVASHVTRVPSARAIIAACKRGESMGIDGHTYVCVQRAPRVACEQVFSMRGCYWYTAERDQILFTPGGLVATEGP
jgi:hypothetical protein